MTVSPREMDTLRAALETWANSGARLRTRETQKYCFNNGGPLSRTEALDLLQRMEGQETLKETATG